MKQKIGAIHPTTKVTGILASINNIDTEVVNGNISGNQSGIKTHENRDVTYSPNPGCHLLEVIVDGAKVDPASFQNGYTFRDIQKDHSIKAVYIPDPVKSVQ